MYGYIYKTTNLINNRIYIGKHRSKNGAFDDNYFGSGTHIKNAIKFYGKSNFTVEPIEWCNSLEEMNLRETFWIEQLNSRDPEIGYNLKSGGDGGWDFRDWSGENNGMYGVHRYGSDNPAFGRKHTDDEKEKMRCAIKARGGHHGKNNPMFGKKHSSSSKEKMSDALRKREVTDETRMRMSASRTGRKHTEATKKKMSENNAMHNPDYRKKVSDALKGKPSKCAGRVWIHDSQYVTKMILKEDLGTYLSMGWKRGRK